MAVSRIDRLLARTDPFDLSQAVERYVYTLPADRVRSIVTDAAPRMGSYYRTEFLRLLGREHDEFALAVTSSNEAGLRDAFARFLRSNLRAIPIFGSPFGLAVLEHAPVERAVGIGEETPRRGTRAAIFAGGALALLLIGAAGEHIVSARSTPPPPEPVAIAVPSPSATREARPTAASKPLERRSVAAQKVAPVQAPPPQRVAASPAYAAPQMPAQQMPAPQPAVTPAPTLQPPHGRGVAVIAVTEASPTPTPQPSDLDVTDMPESYTDATPLPEPSAAPVAVGSVRVATPKPSPKHHSWIHRAIMHLDPFKPHPRGSPPAR